jgi:hypothetical protein
MLCTKASIEILWEVYLTATPWFEYATARSGTEPTAIANNPVGSVTKYRGNVGSRDYCRCLVMAKESCKPIARMKLRAT